MMGKSKTKGNRWVLLDAQPAEAGEANPRPPAATLNRETHAGKGWDYGKVHWMLRPRRPARAAGSYPAHGGVSGFPTSLATAGFNTTHLAASDFAAAA